jgi:hypothetical protein
MNLNVSQQAKPAPVHYSPFDPPPPAVVVINRPGMILSTGFLLFLISGTLLFAGFAMLHPSGQVGRSLWEMILGGKTNDARRPASVVMARDIKDSYKLMDQYQSKKSFPDTVLAADYTEADGTQREASLRDRDQARHALLEKLNVYDSVSFSTQADNIVLSDPQTALVSATIDFKGAGSLNRVAPQAIATDAAEPNEKDASTSVVGSQISKAMDIWKRREDGSWILQKRTLLGAEFLELRMDDDPKSDTDSQEQPEDPLAEFAEFRGYYEEIDEERKNKQEFPFSQRYFEHWQEVDTRERKINFKEAQQRFADAARRTDAVSFITTMNEAIWLDSRRALIKTTLRVEAEKQGSQIYATGIRQEADYWVRGENDVWGIEKTRHLSDSPLLNSLGF